MTRMTKGFSRSGRNTSHASSSRPIVIVIHVAMDVSRTAVAPLQPSMTVMSTSMLA
jgi:hypothetical protein